MRFKLYRITAFTATSLACIVFSLGIQVSAQETKTESTIIEATINGEAIPENAKTVEIPTIEVEDLDLLVKPLTLEELRNEAAAWLILLKNKVQEISNAEITIKNQNRKLDAQQESIKVLQDTQLKLLAASKSDALDDKTINQLSAAKEAMQNAIASAQELRQIEIKIAKNKALIDSIRQGKQERGIKEAREVLRTAFKIREDFAPNSPLYKEITDKIDALESAIADLETAQINLDSTIPGSQAYGVAASNFNQAREILKNNRAELRKILLEAVTDSALSEDNLAQKAAKREAKFVQVIESLEDIEPKIDIQSLDPNLIQDATQKIDNLTEVINQKLTQGNALKKQIVVNVTNLEVEKSAMMNRFETILDALDKKGGDSASYRKYVEAISSVDLDITDAESLEIRFVSWLTAPDGGLLLLLNILKFVSIVLISVVAAPHIGKLTNDILLKIGGMSALFRSFIVMVIKRGFVVLGFLLALAALGISLGPILALIGGASFILAFALQNNLANFASGLMLLINKPFDVGDEIKVAGYWAYVDSISLASTRIRDFGGNIITLPNNTVWGSDIINYTHADLRKLSLPIHVRFSQDINVVYEMWKEMAFAHPQVLDDPQPSWFPWNSHYDSYVWINLMAWCTTEDYWSVYLDLLIELQKRIKESNINMATPRQEILLNQSLPKAIATQKSLLE